MTKSLRAVVFISTTMLCLSFAAMAQRQERSLSCDGNWGGRGDGPQAWLKVGMVCASQAGNPSWWRRASMEGAPRRCIA